MESGKSITIPLRKVINLFNGEPKNGDSISITLRAFVINKSQITKKSNSFEVNIWELISKEDSQQSNLNIYLDTIKKPTKDEAQDQIKSKYGTNTDMVKLFPNGKSVATLNTTIKCISSDSNNYQIQVGNGNKVSIPKNYLNKHINRELNNGDSIKVIIGLAIEEEKANEYKLTLKDLTAGLAIIHTTENENNDDDSESDSESDSDSDSDTNTDSDEDHTTWWEDKWDDLTNIMGHIKIKLLDICLIPFDALQSNINSIQTSKYNNKDKLANWNILMEPEEILNDSNKNKYAYYSKGTENLGKKDKQKIKNINVRDEGLEEVTTIPIIPVEFYTFAEGKVDLFDINFLTGQNDKELHSTSSSWLIVRNFVSGVIHIIIYVGSALLIITLILHGIAIVQGTLTPDERKEHIGGIKEFAKSTIMLVAAVLIMGISIFMVQGISRSFIATDADELPIRINVGEGNLDGKNNDYSFSTNVMGYYRFMAQINQPKLADFKSLYVVIYCLLVLINAIATFAMVLRLCIMVVLSILGPIIAIASAFNIKSIFGFSYQRWIITYVLIASIQIILALVYTIALRLIF